MVSTGTDRPTTGRSADSKKQLRRTQILTVFLVEAVILSSTGGLIGLAAAYLLDRAFMLVYPNFPVQPPLWAVCGAILLSVAVGVTFGLLPARRAARLDPVVSLGSG